MTVNRLKTIARSWHFCNKCGLVYHAPKAPLHTCQTPAEIEARKIRDAQVVEAADRLGVTLEHARNYTNALLRWRAAGYPVRSADQVASIYAEHCEPCDERVGNRCRKCGCRVVAKGIPVLNKLAMDTEECPEGKW